MRENRLRWVKLVLKMGETKAIKLVNKTYVDGKRIKEDRKKGYYVE